MADWKTGCYYTFDKSYEVAQLEAFFRMYEKVIDAFAAIWLVALT